MTATATPAPTDATDTLETLGRRMQDFVRLIANGRMVETILKQSRLDLTRADMQVLHSLRETNGGIRLGELADRLLVDAPTVTRRVQQLETRQLVRRQNDPLDKRAQLVQLTPAGVRLLERAIAAYHRWLEGVVAGWSEDERTQLAQLLERFTTDADAGIGSNGH